MTRRWWIWGVPAIGGALLAVALLRHGHVEAAPAPQTDKSNRSICRTKPDKSTCLIRQSSVAPPVAGTPEGELVEESTRDLRAEAMREAFWKYRSAVACDDDASERSLYPLLLLDRETSRACAREEIAGAPTELDRELSKKAEKALLARIAESEAR